MGGEEEDENRNLGDVVVSFVWIIGMESFVFVTFSEKLEGFESWRTVWVGEAGQTRTRVCPLTTSKDWSWLCLQASSLGLASSSRKRV